MSTQTHAQTAKAETAQAADLCILVVEDDAADAYLISRVLERQPGVAKVIRACDGVEALDLVESGRANPDLAFIDLHMPRKNGFNLLAAFGGRTELNFPMVVLTSSTAPTDAIRSRLRGAIRVVTKPDTVEELETVLRATITAVCPSGRRSGASGLHAQPDVEIVRTFAPGGDR
ncbi:MAG TPA: response regulator [Caulobacteraceae bacterium]|nr:response regulator [Caulobacteraceae bacterium]